MVTKLRKSKKVDMESRLRGRNKIIAMNKWAVSLIQYGAGIIKWNVAELDETDWKIRRLMRMSKEFLTQM